MKTGAREELLSCKISHGASHLGLLEETAWKKTLILVFRFQNHERTTSILLSHQGHGS